MSDYRLITDATMAANGWAAWSRDKEGKICTSHATFNDIVEWASYVVGETQRGLRVFYPPGPLLVDMDLDEPPENVAPAAVFPPPYCTAYEDCCHDGLCHDPKCCAAIGPNHEAFYGRIRHE